MRRPLILLGMFVFAGCASVDTARLRVYERLRISNPWAVVAPRRAFVAPRERVIVKPMVVRSSPILNAPKPYTMIVRDQPALKGNKLAPMSVPMVPTLTVPKPDAALKRDQIVLKVRKLAAISVPMAPILSVPKPVGMIVLDRPVLKVNEQVPMFVPTTPALAARSYDAAAPASVPFELTTIIGDGLLTDALALELLNRASSWMYSGVQEIYIASSASDANAVALVFESLRSALQLDLRPSFDLPEDYLADVIADSILADARAGNFEKNADLHNDLAWLVYLYPFTSAAYESFGLFLDRQTGTSPKEKVASICAWAAEHKGGKYAEIFAYYAAFHFYRLMEYEPSHAHVDRYLASYSKYRDRAKIVRAMCYMNQSENDKARAILASFPMEFPDSPLLPQVSFMTAWLYLYDQDIDTAKPVLRALVREYPGSIYAQKSQEILRQLPEGDAP